MTNYFINFLFCYLIIPSLAYGADMLKEDKPNFITKILFSGIALVQVYFVYEGLIKGQTYLFNRGAGMRVIKKKDEPIFFWCAMGLNFIGLSIFLYFILS